MENYLTIGVLLATALVGALSSIFFLRKNHPDGDPTDLELIHQAAKKADEIVAEAELEGIKIAAETKIGAKTFHDAYDTKLNQTLEQAEAGFKLNLDNAQKQYQELIKKLTDQSIQETQQTQNLIRSRVNETLLNFEQSISSYLTSAEQKSFEAINLELRSARGLIDTYKQQQLALIDENIVAVLERTLSLVMRQKLTLKDEIDLVFEALEKAKVEKFFL